MLACWQPRGTGDFMNLNSRISLAKPAGYYHRDAVSTGERLRIAGGDSAIELMLFLAEQWERGCYIVYVLAESARAGVEPGRYQSPGPIAISEVATFLQRFASAFQGGHRQQVWIVSVDEVRLLVLDRHGCVWAYGDVPTTVRLLEQQGYVAGELPVVTSSVVVPHDGTTGQAADVLAYWDWRWFPLHPGDRD